jgi:Ras-related protein Rab-8A
MKAKGPDIIKFVILGDSGVGKSCLLLRFCDNEFNASFVATVGIDFKIRTLQLSDGSSIRLQLWDTAGQERFRAISSAFYRGAQAVIIVYAIDNKPSFANCPVWLAEYQEKRSQDAHPYIALLGNKCENEKERTVKTEDARAWAATNNMSHFEVSAKSGLHVVECFTTIAVEVTRRLATTKAAAAAAATAQQEQHPTDSNKCC